MNEVKRPVILVLNDLANRIEAKAVKIIREEQLVAWKTLFHSTKTKVDEANLVVRVYSAPHAEYIQEGRKPDKMPPVRPIEEWLRQKKIPPRDEGLAERVKNVKLSAKINDRAKLSKRQQELADHYHVTAWKIAQKMKRDGMKPRRFLLRAVIEACRESPYVESTSIKPVGK